MAAPDRKAGIGLVGLGAAACAACCAGPILGFFAAAGIASVLGAVLFGIVGVAAVAGAAALVWARRRNRHFAPAPDGPVPLADPELRARR